MKKLKQPSNFFYNKQSHEEYEESLWGNYENSDNLPISGDHPYDDTNIDNLKDYLKYCEKVGLQIELTQEFPIDKFVLSGGRDLLYDFENHPEKKPEGLFNCLSEAIFDSSFEDFQSRGWHFWTHKWMIQDIMARGMVIPINVSVWKTKNWVHKFKSNYRESKKPNGEVYNKKIDHWGFYSAFQLKRVDDGETDKYWQTKDGKFYDRAFAVHPGGGKINVLNFLKIEKSPALITSWKDDEISYGGKLLKTVDDYVDLIKSISKHYATFLNHDEDNAHRAEYAKNPQDVLNFKKVNLYSKGNYKLQAYLDEPPACFGKVLENTFPLKIYIGSDGDKDFHRCKKMIENNRLRDKYHKGKKKEYSLFGSVVGGVGADFHPKCIKIGRNEFDKIPYNNQGFVIYTDSSIIWHRDVFELLFFGNYKKAFSRVENNNQVILFNCDYSGWKYTDMQNIDEFDITKLPPHYLKQEVISDF